MFECSDKTIIYHCGSRTGSDSLVEGFSESLVFLVLVMMFPDGEPMHVIPDMQPIFLNQACNFSYKKPKAHFGIVEDEPIYIFWCAEDNSLMLGNLASLETFTGSPEMPTCPCPTPCGVIGPVQKIQRRPHCAPFDPVIKRPGPT